MGNHRELPKRPEERPEKPYKFTMEGEIIYNCRLCYDSGWVHPLKENGKPDWGKVVPCRCRRQVETASDSPVKGTLFGDILK